MNPLKQVLHFLAFPILDRLHPRSIPTEFQGSISFTGAFELPSVRHAEASRLEDRHLQLGSSPASVGVG